MYQLKSLASTISCARGSLVHKPQLSFFCEGELLDLALSLSTLKFN